MDEEMKTDGANDKVILMFIDAGSRQQAAGSRPVNAGQLILTVSYASEAGFLKLSTSQFSHIRFQLSEWHEW